MDDPGFEVLRRALGGLDGDGSAAYEPDPDLLEAAVSLVLREGDEPALLLIKRAERDTDPWSGHMALPGGRREDADGSFLETAVRETREETGLDLDVRGKALGRLPDLAPTNPRLPRMVIRPFVFRVPPGTGARVASDEVTAVHWVTLSELLDPGSESTVAIPREDGHRDFPCLRVQGEVVWGLTYRILGTLFERLPDTV